MTNAPSSAREAELQTRTYKVVITGIRPDLAQADAKASLAKLFKASPEQIDKLLSARNYTAKRALSFDVAAKYRDAIEKAGGLSELVAEIDPVVLLDVELPSTDAPSPSPKAVAELSDGWKRKFALIEKAGGTDWSNLASLDRGDLAKVNFNIWGFVFGPFYYLAKGMWKKGLVLFAIVFVANYLLGAFFDDGAIANQVSTVIGSSLSAVFSNRDYYKKMILGINSWW